MGSIERPSGRGQNEILLNRTGARRQIGALQELPGPQSYQGSPLLPLWRTGNDATGGRLAIPIVDNCRQGRRGHLLGTGPMKHLQKHATEVGR